MRKYLIILILLYSCQKSDIILRPVVSEARKVLSADTTINTVWDGGGKVLRIEDHKIHGTGTLQNWIIDAAYSADIFDTSINIVGCGTYNDVFSCAWYGAKENNTDNWWNIQKSINTCLNNGLKNCYLPKGVYKYSKPLEILSVYNGIYVGCTLHFYGESSFWDSGNGTTLAYSHYADCALNLQLNKGSEIDHFTITGKWQSPVTPDSIYYNTAYANYNDISGLNCNEWYYGLAVDWRNQINNANRNGSTGLKIHDLYITGFTKCFAVSQRQTQNGEIILFENIRVGECRVGFATGQAEEKDNWIKGIYSWGRCHTLLQIGISGEQASAGNWHIEGGNIAGRCVRVFDIVASGWYSTTVENLFAESIGFIGNLYGAVPITITSSTFHLVMPEIMGQRVVMNTSGSLVTFRDCIIRYYGTNYDIWVRGLPTFDGGIHSGNIVLK